MILSKKALKAIINAATKKPNKALKRASKKYKRRNNSSS